MAKFNCSKCDSQGLEWKEGVSKKTGNKWTAWYCPDCKLMHGMNGVPWGDRTAQKTNERSSDNGSQVPQVTLLDIKKQLDRIEKKLNGQSSGNQSVEATEEVPF